MQFFEALLLEFFQACVVLLLLDFSAEKNSENKEECGDDPTKWQCYQLGY